MDIGYELLWYKYWYWSSIFRCLKNGTSKNFNLFSPTKNTTEFQCELRYCDEIYLYTPNFLKTEIFKSFYSMHFYLDLLLVKSGYYVEFMTYICFSAWSKHVSFYVMTVEFNCNSMSTKVVLIVSINFEELVRKKHWF